MIEFKNICKSFKDVEALKNFNLSIDKAKLFGVIGPDGAGKTTLFRILTTLLVPDSGNATLAGFDTVKDYREIRKIVGYMPGDFSLYSDLTVEENLNFFASVFGTTIEENYHLIKDVYCMLEPFKKRRAGALSGGMKQKLALSCALIHRPEVLVLDEPTTGVDAVSRKEFWENLRQLKKQGITIIVSTPYMDEAEICDEIALVQSGEIMSVDTPEGIVDSFDKKLYAIRCSNMYNLKQQINSYENTDSAFLFGQYIHYTAIDEEIPIAFLKKHLENKGLKDVIVQPLKPNIEDCFMRLMNSKSESNG